MYAFNTCIHVVVFVVDLRFSISIKENERTISHGKGQANDKKKHQKRTIFSKLSAYKTLKYDLNV